MLALPGFLRHPGYMQYRGALVAACAVLGAWLDRTDVARPTALVEWLERALGVSGDDADGLRPMAAVALGQLVATAAAQRQEWVAAASSWAARATHALVTLAVAPSTPPLDMLAAAHGVAFVLASDDAAVRPILVSDVAALPGSIAWAAHHYWALLKVKLQVLRNHESARLVDERTVADAVKALVSFCRSDRPVRARGGTIWRTDRVH